MKKNEKNEKEKERKEEKKMSKSELASNNNNVCVSVCVFSSELA